MSPYNQSSSGSTGRSPRPFSPRSSARPTSRPPSAGHRTFNGRIPRPSFGASRSGGYSSASRGGYRGNRGGGRNRFAGERIDISKFINKAVVTEEVGPYVPEHHFTDFTIDAALKKNIIAKKYELPTPIQDRAIPHILRGEDVVGIANTGTGKTAAFLIPLIHKVLANKKEQVIIVVPTRELAIQIQDELKSFTKGLGLFSVCCVGGSPIGRQLSELHYFNSFIIGTPGRLKDVIERGALNLLKFNTVVLDEADRMLDMGFVHDMKWMMARMPSPRHTLFFSATLSRDIEALINDFLKNPVRISVKTQDTSKNVDQDVVRVPAGKDKIDVLVGMLKEPGYDKVLIFGRTKHGVEKLADALTARGIKATSIHGNKNQSQRQRALTHFKNSHVQALVATDVAARGLDIDGVSHVINFDLPQTYDDYVHRIGRTGRGGKKGKALTFVG